MPRARKLCAGQDGEVVDCEEMERGLVGIVNHNLASSGSFTGQRRCGCIGPYVFALIPMKESVTRLTFMFTIQNRAEADAT